MQENIKSFLPIPKILKDIIDISWKPHAIYP